MKKNIKPYLQTAKTLIIDVLCINIAVFCALAVRLEFDFAQVFTVWLSAWLWSLTLVSVSYLLNYFLFGIHRIIWNYAGLSDIARLAFCSISATAMFSALSLLIKPMPKSVYVISAVFMLCILLVPIAFKKAKGSNPDDDEYVKPEVEISKPQRIIVIGAGDAGNTIIHDIKNNKSYSQSKVVCIIDDDKSKHGKTIYGIPIIGGRDCIITAAEKYSADTVLFAIPGCSHTDKAAILNICTKTGCEIRTLPALHQLVSGELSIANTHKVNIDDLLGREPVIIDNAGINKLLHGKTVLVTGGGGSIGSELCRQIAAQLPKELIIFDICENPVFELCHQLKGLYPELVITSLIGSVRDENRVDAVFAEYKPDVVYHAAAHKHVPLMEQSPHEAVKNNVFGTYNVAKAAKKHGISRFVLISTDKAVNPTNIMGATKRICEMIVQTMAIDSKTVFSAVRFGNVLGSSGSVLPLFKRQIDEGGPITVTHPEITRFFMTIPEATALVLQASLYARGGEIFVLDMGEPVRILDMAEKFIRLSGFEPYEEIRIVFTGLRPGEKLYEELLMDEEGVTDTENTLIHIGKPLKIDCAEFETQLSNLKNAAYDETGDIKQEVAKIAVTYKPQ